MEIEAKILVPPIEALPVSMQEDTKEILRELIVMLRLKSTHELSVDIRASERAVLEWMKRCRDLQMPDLTRDLLASMQRAKYEYHIIIEAVNFGLLELEPDLKVNWPRRLTDIIHSLRCFEHYDLKISPEMFEFLHALNSQCFRFITEELEREAEYVRKNFVMSSEELLNNLGWQS